MCVFVGRSGMYLIKTKMLPLKWNQTRKQSWYPRFDVLCQQLIIRSVMRANVCVQIEVALPAVFHICSNRQLSCPPWAQAQWGCSTYCVTPPILPLSPSLAFFNKFVLNHFSCVQACDTDGYTLNRVSMWCYMRSVYWAGEKTFPK